MAFPEDLLLMGSVVGSHGLGGLLKILSFAESEASFLKTGIVYLGPDPGNVRAYRVASVRPHKKAYLMKLEEIASLEDAEKQKGTGIFLPREAVQQRDEDGFLWHDLMGLEVYLDTGRHVGTLSHILPTGSHDLYVVSDGQKEVFVPAVHEVVREIDLEGKRMVIAGIEGLLELNAV